MTEKACAVKTMIDLKLEGRLLHPTPASCSESYLNLKSVSQLGQTLFWLIISQNLSKRLEIREGVCTPQSNHFFTKLSSRQRTAFF